MTGTSRVRHPDPSVWALRTPRYDTTGTPPTGASAAIELQPGDIETRTMAYLNRSIDHLHSGRLKEALADATTVTELLPADRERAHITQEILDEINAG